MRKKTYVCFMLLLITILFSCGSYRTKAVWSDERPLGSQFPSVKDQSTTRTSHSDSMIFKELGGNLALQQALAAALMNNPELSVFAWEVRAREARALQASLFPNPELELEVENFGGSGSYGAVRSSETTLSLGQLIELAGKREKRTKVAALNGDLAGWDYEAKRLDVFTEVVKIFTTVLTAQERVRVNEELLILAEKFVKTIQRQVKAGKISTAEESRAQVELSVAQVEIERARRELNAARQRLAATWGSVVPIFDKVEGQLDVLPDLPTLEELMAFINDNPDVARWMVEIEQRRAVSELAAAKRIPDPTLWGGYRRLNQSSDNLFVFSLSVPLLIFDRNQGAVQEAEYRLKQSKVQRVAVEVATKSRLFEKYQLLSVLNKEVSTLQKKIIPDATNAFEVINQGYLLGKFAPIDVLDAQRTLFEARGRYLRSLSGLHQTAADMERLIGRSLGDVK